MKTQPLVGIKNWVWAIAVLLSAAQAGPARGATFLVTNTNDSGAGSLRQAILSANSTLGVPDVINFNIPGAGPHIITPPTALPTVTDPLIIDGYTQPNASPNTLADGDDAVLQIEVNDTLIIDTSNSVVRGLSLRSLNLGTMNSLALGGNIVQGNFVGLDPTGTNSLNGMSLLTYIPNNLIGGTTPAARNVISGHQNFGGIEMLVNGNGNTVQGNFIGTDNTGTKAMPNGDRAVVSGMAVSSNTIGGTVAGARNVISGNLNRGITLDGSNNVVQGNFIGTDVTGLRPLGNARTGIEIGGPGNLVGGTNSGAGNIIAFNGVDGGGLTTTNGIDVNPGVTGYAILGNSIFSNRGLGIDVNADGLVTPGFPVLTVVSNTGAAALVKGTYTPNVTFRLELFSNPSADASGYGEGKTLLISTNITTDAGGNFSINLPFPITPGLFLTATAQGMSEFSKDFFVTVPGRTNDWINSSSGKWEIGANWSLNVPPFAGLSLVLITNAGTKTVTSDSTTASGFPTTLTISNLVISAPNGAINTLLLAHGGTSTPMHILNSLTLKSGGALVVNNAALNLDGPLGTAYSLDGALTLNDGLLTVTNSQVQIGNNGAGSLTVSNGTFLAFYPIIGANPGANGTWNIAGGTNLVASVFDISDSLTATGKVVMTGGQLITPTCYVGLFGNGSLVVSNGDFQCLGSMDVASQGGAQGNFTAAGGTSIIGSMLIGESSGATGSVLVTGSALVQIAGQLDERGSIAVTGGQLSVTNDNSFLTHVTVSNGTFLARDVFLGNSVFGSCSVANGGVVALPGSFNGFSVGVNGGTGVVSQVGGQILLGNTDLNVGGLFGAAVGQMTISGGLTLAYNLFVGGQGDGTGTFTMAGGTLIATNLAVNSLSRFIFNKGLVQTWAASVANALPLLVGDGSNAAELNLLGGTSAFPAGLRIASGSALTGYGTISGSLIVSNGGRFSPGAPFGTIILSNSPSMQGTVVMELGKNGSTRTNDLIQVIAPLTYGGSLTVSNLGPTALTLGDSFKLFDAKSYAGSFATLSLPPLNPGLGWTNRLLVDGSIGVIGVPVPKFATINLSGNSLIITGTGGSPNSTYTVLSSTNVALPISNWINIAVNQFGAGGEFSFTNGITAGASQRFYQIRIP